jgi:hypothetical protein
LGAVMPIALLLRRMSGLAVHTLRGRGGRGRKLRLGPDSADTIDTLRKL